MVCSPVVVSPPTLAALRQIGAKLAGAQPPRFDRTLAAARADIGPTCDPSDPVQAARLLKWLNDWNCRIAYASEAVFVASLGSWWLRVSASLPPPGATLAALTNDQVARLAEAYGDLYRRQAARRANGVTTAFGPTAAAKLLYFVRPLAVTAWDEQIAGHVGCDRTAGGFASHLEKCGAWAGALVGEAAAEGKREAEIGTIVGRPKSSLAKLIDEYLYLTITRRER